MLWKLLDTVKWSTFCVSFIRVLTMPGWLWCSEIFKIDYLVTPNVRFGMVSINAVTNNISECMKLWDQRNQKGQNHLTAFVQAIYSNETVLLGLLTTLLEYFNLNLQFSNFNHLNILD